MKLISKSLIALISLIQLLKSYIGAKSNRYNLQSHGTYKAERYLMKNVKQFDFLEETRVAGNPSNDIARRVAPVPQMNADDIKGLYSLNKEFAFGSRLITCYRVDGTVNIDKFTNFEKKMGKKWWRPQNSNEGNTIITFYKNNYVQQGLDAPYTWIITYGVETKPNQRLVNGQYLNTDVASGWGQGDDNIPGRSNGSSWTAFRAWANSFCYMKQFNKASCWDGIKYGIICLE